MKKSVLLLFIFFGLSGWLEGQVNPQSFNNLTAQQNQVVVPSLIGENVEIAFQQIANAGLENGNITRLPGNQPAGTVLRQFPQAGAVVNTGTPVNLYISIGPTLVTVPSVINRTLEEAQEILSVSQLQRGNLREQFSDAESGRILFQNPPPGDSVSRGSFVDLTIAIQKPDVKMIVPNVIGMLLEKARNVMDEAGLPIENVYYENSNAEEGTVIVQRPSPGQQVEKGTPVTFIVAQPNYPPSWLYWGGGIVAALLLGGYLGWKSGKGKQQQNRAGKKDPDLKVVVIPDSGKQTIRPDDIGQPVQGLQLQIIPDKGVQTLKTN